MLLSLASLVTLPLLSQLLQFAAVVSAEEQEVLSASSRASNASLLWGPYRPNLYFGIKPRIPKSLLTGLLWAKVDEYKDVQTSS